MHFKMNKQSKINTNVLSAKWILVNTIIWVDVITKIILNRNSTLTKEDHLHIHPLQFRELKALGNGFHMFVK